MASTPSRESGGQRAAGPRTPDGPTNLGEGVVIEGEVKGNEDLVIDGKVDGTIELPEHVMTIGPTGRITAQVLAKSLVILGTVTGTIRASETVSIGETGRVEGEFSAPRLVVAEGAYVQGRVDV